MEESNLAILVDAKKEYTKQLTNLMKHNLFQGFKSLYDTSKTYCLDNKLEDRILSKFQKNVSEIPKWNQDIILKKYEDITSKCDWLPDLITAVFLSHTRILSSIKMNKSKKKIDLVIPKVDHFIHMCYIDLARVFWKRPYLFDDTIDSYKYQQNRREIESTIEDSIIETIRSQLPVRNILKEYLSEDDNDKYTQIRDMVKEEIVCCSKEQLEYINTVEEPVVVKEEPVLVEEELVVVKEEPVLVVEELAVVEEEPVVVEEELAVVKEELAVVEEMKEYKTESLDTKTIINDPASGILDEPEVLDLDKLANNTNLDDVKSELDLFELDELEELTLESNTNTLESNNIKKIVLEINDADEDNKPVSRNNRQRNYNFFDDSLDNED